MYLTFFSPGLVLIEKVVFGFTFINLKSKRYEGSAPYFRTYNSRWKHFSSGCSLVRPARSSQKNFTINALYMHIHFRRPYFQLMEDACHYVLWLLINRTLRMQLFFYSFSWRGGKLKYSRPNEDEKRTKAVRFKANQKSYGIMWIICLCCGIQTSQVQNYEKYIF